MASRFKALAVLLKMNHRMAHVMGRNIADGPDAQVSTCTSAARAWFVEAYAVEVRDMFSTAGVRIVVDMRPAV